MKTAALLIALIALDVTHEVTANGSGASKTEALLELSSDVFEWIESAYDQCPDGWEVADIEWGDIEWIEQGPTTWTCKKIGTVTYRQTGPGPEPPPPIK